MYIKRIFKAILLVGATTIILLFLTARLAERNTLLTRNVNLIDHVDNVTRIVQQETKDGILQLSGIISNRIIGNRTSTFPIRSPQVIEGQLNTAKDVMAPVFEEIQKLRKVLLLSNYTWQQPTKPSVVLSSADKSFMSQLIRNSNDILKGKAGLFLFVGLRYPPI